MYPVCCLRMVYVHDWVEYAKQMINVVLSVSKLWLQIVHLGIRYISVCKFCVNIRTVDSRYLDFAYLE